MVRAARTVRAGATVLLRHPASGRLRALVALACFLVLLGAVSATQPWLPPSSSAPSADRDAAPRPGTSGTRSEEDVPPDDLPGDTVLVWSGAHLAEGYAQAVAEDPRVGPATVVRGEWLELVRTESADGDVVDEPPEGWALPVEVLAFDPATYDELTGRDLIADLAPDEVLLGETSAQVRGLGPGAHVEFATGARLRVAGVVPDALIGHAEVATRGDGPLEVGTEKYLLARPGDVDGLTEALRAHGDADREPRLVAHGEAPVLRHAHGALTAAERKEHFGEFAMQDRPGRDIRAGASWIREHVEVASVPILGRVQCHRKVIEPLRAAMRDLVDRGAEHVVSDYAGCWVPRTSGSDGPLSSHAWGMSVDFNAQSNPYGAEPRQPDVLVEVMREHGFIWGGEWDTPDGMHFELSPGRDPHSTP